MNAVHRLAFLFLVFCFSAGAGNAAASQYDIKVMTPEIKRAIENRQSRLDLIREMKAKGLIGENNRGFVAVLDQQEVADPIVAEENLDRQVIYQAIVEQNALGAQGMEQVQAAFAEVQREKARPGDFIQMPAGQWVRK